MRASRTASVMSLRRCVVVRRLVGRGGGFLGGVGAGAFGDGGVEEGLFGFVEGAALHEVFHGAGAAHEGGGAGVADPKFPFVAVGDVEDEGAVLEDAEFFGELAEVGVEFAALGIGRGFGEQAGDDADAGRALEVGEFVVKVLARAGAVGMRASGSWKSESGPGSRVAVYLGRAAARVAKVAASARKAWAAGPTRRILIARASSCLMSGRISSPRTTAPKTLWR